MSEFPKKWASKLPENFEDKVTALSEDEIQKEIMAAEIRLSDTEKEMDLDQKLLILKEDLKALSGGYKDVMKTETAKIKFCMFTLRERGKV